MSRAPGEEALRLLWAGKPQAAAPTAAQDARAAETARSDDLDWFRADPHAPERRRLTESGEAPGLWALPEGWVRGVRATSPGDGSRAWEYVPTPRGEVS